MSDFEDLRRISQSNYLRFLNNLIDADQRQSFKLIGYDLTTGKYKLMASDGTILYTEAMTNGGVARDQIIRLRGGGAFPGFDAMPTFKRSDNIFSSAAIITSSQGVIYPVKTIFIAGLKVYLGGDRESVELFDLSNKSIYAAYIYNVSSNQFFSYVSYQTNRASVAVNKDSQDNQITFADPLNFPRNYYIGKSLDTNEVKYDWSIDATREVFLGNELKTVRNGTLNSLTDKTDPNGNFWTQDFSIEIDSVNKNGETVTTSFSKNTNLIFSEKYPVFYEYVYQSSYTRIEDSITDFDILSPKQIYRDNTAISRIINSHSQGNFGTIELQGSGNVSSARKVGTYTGPAGNIYISWEYFYPVWNNGVVTFFSASAGDTPVGESPPDSPSSAGGTFIREISTTFYSSINNPNKVFDNEYVNIDFSGLAVNNLFLRTVYPDAEILIRKKAVEDSLLNQSGGGNTISQSVVWDDNFVFYQIFTTASFFASGPGDVSYNVEETGIDQPYIIPSFDAYVIMEEKTIYSISGNESIFIGETSEIVQEFEAEIETVYGHDEDVSDGASFRPNEKRYKRIPYFIKNKKETKNIVKLKNANGETILNNGNFGCLKINSANTTVSGLTGFSSVGESFTITYTNSTLRLLKNINKTEFTGNGFTGNYLLSFEYTGKKFVVKGSSMHEYNPDAYTLTINCTIAAIQEIPSSFPNIFIMNNGSCYNYFFRKNISVYDQLYGNKNPDGSDVEGALFSSFTLQTISESFNDILSKEIFPFIPLSANYQGLLEYYITDYVKNCGKATINIANTDNLIDNKIFSVAKTENDIAWVEEWNILNNGQLIYSRVFTTPYIPLPDGNIQLGHSYHPGS